jgi:hypothetical protein
MKTLSSVAIFYSAVVMLACGCGPAEVTFTKKASYKDLVETYNAEVQTLDNLEGKRKELIVEHSKKQEEEMLKSAISALGAAGQQKVPSNPNAALDQAVAAAEMQAKLQSGLLDKVGGSGGNSAKSGGNAEYPEPLKSKLAELDAEIAKQKDRVEKARNARDAAESK